MHILLYAPNVIGYLRVFFMIMSWSVAFENCNMFTLYYAISYFLDIADGKAARLLNQCSTFGAILDMITDRVCSALLFAILAQIYKEYYMFFFGLLALDIGAHWLQMYTSSKVGGTTHKETGDDVPFMIRVYYKYQLVIGWLCFCEQYFVGYLYGMAPMFDDNKHVLDPISFTHTLFWISIPFMVWKQAINFAQIYFSAMRLVDYDLQ